MRLRRNAIAGLIGTVTIAITNVAIVALLLRSMGPEVYGAWTIIASILAVVGLGDLGLSAAMTYHVARVSDLKSEEIGRFAWAGCILAFGMGVVLGVSLFMGASPVVEGLFRVPEPLATPTVTGLRIASVTVPVVMLGSAIRGGIDGLGAMDVSNAIASGQALLRAGLFVLVVIFHQGIVGLSIATLVATCCAWFVGTWYLGNRVRWRFSSLAHLRGDLKLILSYGAVVQVGNALSAVGEPALRAIISRKFGVALLGYFEAGYSVARMLRALVQSALYASLPETAKRRESCQDLVALYNTTLRHTVAAGAFLSGVALVCGEPLTKLWVGEHAAPVYQAFWAMTAALTPSILHSPLYFLLQGSGYVGLVALAMSITVGVALGGTLLLTEFIGYLGVFVAYGLATVITTVFLVASSKIVTEGLPGITLKWFFDYRVWGALAVAVGTAGIAKYLWTTPVWELIGAGVLFVGAFGAALIVTSYYSIVDLRPVWTLLRRAW